MMKVIRRATIEDLEGILAFLDRAELSTDGVEEAIDYFLVMEDSDDTMLGTLGMEIKEGNGLLRSLVVEPGLNTEDLFALFQEILKLAKEKGLQNVFLISNKKASVQFFSLLGFQEVEKEHSESLGSFEHIQNLSTLHECSVMGLKL